MKGKSINPFVQALSVDAVKVYSDKEFIDKGDWIDSDNVKLPKVLGGGSEHTYNFSYLVEVEQSSKLYRNEKVNKLIKGLSDRASRMLIYVMQNLPKNSEVVEIVPADYQKEFNVSSIQTVYNAIRDLMDANFIARHKPNKYWINPAVIFNGNRINKYGDNVKITHIISKSKKGNG